jgi:hypothetical protein
MNVMLCAVLQRNEVKSVLTGAAECGLQQLLDNEWQNYHSDTDCV